MTKKKKSRKGAHIRKTLRLCALEIHKDGLLKNLADAMALNPGAFSYWVREGAVPKRKAEWLQARFPNIVDAASLTRTGV